MITFITLKTKKYLGINLGKVAKYLYTKNYSTLMKDIVETTKSGKIFIFVGKKVNVVKKSLLHKTIYRFNRFNPHQNSNGIFHRYRKKNPKVHM